tara:strand:- start:270 stop:1289 length:1020 start_codon:yes stop_codon:yes gene_type:complete
MAKAFDIFKQGSKELLGWLKAAGNHYTIPPEATLVKEGDLNSDLIVLVSGKICVNTTSKEGNTLDLAELTSGSLFGEMSLLEKRPAVATVKALEECIIWQISHEKISSLQVSNPELSLEWQQLIAKKLALQLTKQNEWIYRNVSNVQAIEPLRKVLILFASLNECDIYKLAKIGKLMHVEPGCCLVRQGENVTSLYLLLSGEAEILIEINKESKKVGSSCRGEILGEVTFLLPEQRGASATVKSNGMELLCLDKQELAKLLKEDPNFGARFYIALSRMLSQRSRDQLVSRQLSSLSQKKLIETQAENAAEMDLNELADTSRAGRQFQWLCEKFQMHSKI